MQQLGILKIIKGVCAVGEHIWTFKNFKMCLIVCKTIWEFQKYKVPLMLYRFVLPTGPSNQLWIPKQIKQHNKLIIFGTYQNL